MDCPACREPAEWHPTRPEKVCPRGHRTVPFVRPPRWRPGVCPDGGAAHQARPMNLLDSRNDRVWLCGEGHYVVLEGPKLVDHMSPSSLAVAEQCMARFWNTYVMGRREPAKFPTEVGTFAHDVLDHVGREPDGQRDLDRAKQVAAARWKLYAAGWAFQSLRCDEQDVKRFKWESVNAVASALAQYPLNGRRVVATEQAFQLALAGTPIHGKIDLTVERDGGLAVVDWKTGRFPSTDLATPETARRHGVASDRYQQHLRVMVDDYRKKLRQGHIYVAATRELHSVEDVSAELVYVKPGHEGVLVADPTETRRVMHDVRHTWQAVQAHQDAGAWPANPGPLCGWCPYLAWPNGDGTFEFCASGVAYARRRMGSEWGWTKKGTNDPNSVPAVVTIRGLDEDQRRVAYALADAVGPLEEAA